MIKLQTSHRSVGDVLNLYTYLTKEGFFCSLVVCWELNPVRTGCSGRNLRFKEGGEDGR